MKHTLLLTLLLTSASLAQTNYVALDGLHVPPFTNWLTAATNIQDAVDAALDGNLVLVMTGEYNSGGRPAPGQLLTNRLVVTTPITVQSVFGPQHTIILGSPNLYSLTDTTAVRCAVLENGAVLSGFTFTNSHSLSTGTPYDMLGGGILMLNGAQISNCVITQCTSIDGSAVFAISNCVIATTVITRNDAHPWFSIVSCVDAYDSVIMHDCVLSHNQAPRDTPVYRFFNSTIYNCTFHDTRMPAQFAGVPLVIYQGSSIVHSRICSNTAPGIVKIVRLAGASMIACELHDNSAGLICTHEAGCTTVVERCAFTRHANFAISATDQRIVVNNCMFRRNALTTGNVGFLYNSVSYDNNTSISADAFFNCVIMSNNLNYWSASTMFYYCYLPVADGTGTITSGPVFRDAANGDFRLRHDSPCINAGTNTAEMGAWDFAGQPRVRGYRVDIGAYEFSTTGACIAVTERLIDFGDVLVGDTATNAVRVVSLGDEPVVGMATNVFPPFATVAGAEYTVLSDAYHDVTLAFSPPTEGTHSNVIVLLGGGDEHVVLTGIGVPEPAAMIICIMLGWACPLSARYNWSRE